MSISVYVILEISFLPAVLISLISFEKVFYKYFFCELHWKHKKLHFAFYENWEINLIKIFNWELHLFWLYVRFKNVLVNAIFFFFIYVICRYTVQYFFFKLAFMHNRKIEKKTLNYSLLHFKITNVIEYQNSSKNRDNQNNEVASERSQKETSKPEPNEKKVNVLDKRRR